MENTPTDPIEVRCADCRLEAERFWDDARHLSDADAARGNARVVLDLLLATLWEDVGRAHDEGAR